MGNTWEDIFIVEGF